MQTLRRFFSRGLMSTESEAAKAVEKEEWQKLGQLTNQDRICPYCGFEIEPPPQRRRRCPSCREWIYIKRRPDGPKRLVTKAEAGDIEAE